MKYVCTACGWEYDESAGYPEGGIAPCTRCWPLWALSITRSGKVAVNIISGFIG